VEARLSPKALARRGAPFAVMLVLGVAFAWPALGWPMTFDDLHLMRRFTAAQVLDSFRGHWEPERLMTRGFRPLTMVFNHARTALLGENVAAHRLLVVVLHAAYWALLVPVGRRFGLGPAVVTAAGVLWLASTYTVFHYVWITDGNHALQGLAFAGAALGLLRFLERGAHAAAAASLAAVLLGLLVREDTLAAVPMLFLLGYVRSSAIGPARPRWAAYVAGGTVLCAAVFAYRARVVPRAHAPASNLAGLLEHARKAANPVGEQAFDAASQAAIAGWWVLLAALAVAVLTQVPRQKWTAIGMWLPGALLACAPGLNVARDDLLFFPVTFFALGVAAAAAAVWRARRPLRPLAAAVLAWGVAGGAYVGHTFAQNFHPDSLRALFWNGRYVYGAYSYRANIPPERRAAAVERLRRAGIYNVHHHVQGTRKLVREAVRDGRRRPQADGAPFYPLLPWAED
jgi:hypothetical protein